MPTISMFYGIIINMYNNGEHNPPHFHATYQDYTATFDFDGNILKGSMPQNKLRLIVAWVELHKDELTANWILATERQALYKIEPLR